MAAFPSFVIQFEVVLDRAANSFPASFELLPQTAYGHSNMTRPLAAGGFFVALVPEEPFLGKYNFYGTRLTWENSVFRF